MHMIEERIKLGDKVKLRDIEDGFIGTVTAVAEYLHGTPQTLVLYKEDDQVKERRWTDGLLEKVAE